MTKLIVLRHPVGEMATPPGRPKVRLEATITGEMGVDDIPLAPWVSAESYTALKGGDEDPLELVVEVPAGRSTKGWNYTPKALEDIVGEVNASGLPAFLGHQKVENIPTEFLPPVTHWVGAKMQGTKAYFRGLVDKAAVDLKRWIRGKTIRQVSIFGWPSVVDLAGEITVVGYKPLSIDWTPLNRAGMPTAIVATGEMDSIVQPADDSHEALRDALRAAATEQLGVTNESGSGYLWIFNVYDDYFVAEHEKDGVTNYYQWPYIKQTDGSVSIGERQKVEKILTWVPAAEMGGESMDLKQLVADFKAGKITLAALQTACGEMGITIASAEQATALANLTAIGEMFGGLGGESLIAAVKAAADGAAAQKTAARAALIDTTIKEKVSGEMAQGLVRDMMRLPSGEMTKEIIAGEIDRVLGLESVKGILAKAHVQPTPPAGGGGGGTGGGTYTATAKAQI